MSIFIRTAHFRQEFVQLFIYLTGNHKQQDNIFTYLFTKMGLNTSSFDDKSFDFHKPYQNYINRIVQKNKARKNLNQCEKLDQLPQEQYKKYPHNSIGVLYGNNNQGFILCGSAIFISGNLVMTAAHNIAYKQQFDFKIKFFLSPSVTMNLLTGISCEQFRCPPQFKKQSLKKQQYLKFDFALVKISEIPSDSSQKFLIPTIICRKCLMQKSDSILKIYGYPKSQENKNYKPLNIQATKLSIYQYGLSRANRIVGIQGDQIFYKIATFPCQSGCPLIFQQQFIGVHQGSASNKDDKELSVGLLFSAKILDKYSKWGQQMGAQPFQINNHYCVLHQKQEDSLQQFKNQETIKTDILHKIQIKDKIKNLRSECLQNQSQISIIQSQFKHSKTINQKIIIQQDTISLKKRKAKKSCRNKKSLRKYCNHLRYQLKNTLSIGKQIIIQNKRIDKMFKNFFIQANINWQYYQSLRQHSFFNHSSFYENNGNRLTLIKTYPSLNQYNLRQFYSLKQKKNPNYPIQENLSLKNILILIFQQCKSYQQGQQTGNQLQNIGVSLLLIISYMKKEKYHT